MTDTSEPRSVYERHLAAFNAKDAEADPWSEEAEFVGPGMQARGRGEVMDFLRGYWDAFPDARNEVRRLIVDGALVSAEGVFSGTHTGSLMTPGGEVPPTGRRVEFRWSATCETRAGELVSEHLYFDQLELLTQLGLAPGGAGGAADG